MGFQEHCSDLQGDLTCRAAYTDRPHCSLCESNNQGCVVVPPALICQIDGGTTGSDDEGESSSSSDSTGEGTVAVDSTGADSTTGEPPCEVEGELDPGCLELDPARPFCIDAVCVGCDAAGGDEFCGARDPANPACDVADGDCVSCGQADHAVCEDGTPVCTGSGECRACATHEECPTSACHLGDDDPLQGHCFAPDEVVWVDNAAPCPGQGTEQEPSCSLQAVAATFEPEHNRVIRIKGGMPYAERAVFTGPMTVAIIGDGNPVLTGHPVQQAVTLLFEDEAIGYVQGVSVDGNMLTHGIMCNASSLRLDDVRVRGNAGWGVFDFEPCTLDVRRSAIAGNEDGGLRISGGVVRLDNAVVAVNGLGGNSTGVRVLNAEANILYSTIAGNDGSGADGIECTNATGSLRNSIVVGVDPLSIGLSCFPLAMSNNAFDANNFAGGSNIAVPPYNPVYFEAPAQGNMTLTAPPLTPYGGVALWTMGDPSFDIDGTPRPTGGSLGYAGVDEP